MTTATAVGRPHVAPADSFSILPFACTLPGGRGFFAQNPRLKKLVADQALDMLILTEAARPN